MDIRRLNQQRIWTSAEEKRAVVDFFPEVLEIEITSFCNFRCRMCPHALLENRCARHLDPMVIEKLKPYLQYTRKAALQGDGEPFMHPDLEKIIKGFAENGVRLTTTTNLSMISEHTARLMNETFDVITISCDACEKEVYEKIRRNGSFDVFCKNLDILVSCAPKPALVMNCVMMRQNVHLAEKMVTFAEEHNIRHLVFSALLTTAALHNEDDSLLLYPAITREYLSAAETRAKKTGIDLQILWDYRSAQKQSEAGPEDEWARYRNVKEEAEFTEEERKVSVERYRALKTKKSFKTCQAGKYHCQGICPNLYGKSYIDAEGNVTLCCFGKINAVGNILEQDFSKIWNGDAYVSSRESFFRSELPDFCIGCKFALSAQLNDNMPYPFRITDLDADFEDDASFWKNRTGAEG